MKLMLRELRIRHIPYETKPHLVARVGSRPGGPVAATWAAMRRSTGPERGVVWGGWEPKIHGKKDGRMQIVTDLDRILIGFNDLVMGT